MIKVKSYGKRLFVLPDGGSSPALASASTTRRAMAESSVAARVIAFAQPRAEAQSARMRLLAVADIHDRFEMVDRLLARLGYVDVLVLAGDLTTNGTPEQVEQVIRSWKPRVPHLLAVAGNMDSPAIDEKLEELGVSLHGRCHRIGSMAFFGCSAAPVSIGTPYEVPEAELRQRIESGYAQADGATHFIFVPHAPPRGAVDRTWTGIAAGSTAVRDFIDRVQPGLVLCGHIHEARGQVRLGRSLVVNCGPARRGHYALAEHAADWQVQLH